MVYKIWQKKLSWSIRYIIYVLGEIDDEWWCDRVKCKILEIATEREIEF